MRTCRRPATDEKANSERPQLQNPAVNIDLQISRPGVYPDFQAAGGENLLC
jgi:hypothetical protein